MKGDRFKAAIPIIKRLHAKGYSDPEIAPKCNLCRESIGQIRRKLKLPSNRLHTRQRKRVAENTKEQCRKAGVKNLAGIRSLAFRKFAEKHGWPNDLKPRHVQILQTLIHRGPMTRKEISKAIDMPWHTVHSSLKSNDAEGSYLAHLIKRGFVVSLGRVVKGKGKGHSRQLYAVPLHVLPKVQNEVS